MQRTQTRQLGGCVAQVAQVAEARMVVNVLTGAILWWSEEAERLFGFPEGEAVGMSIERLAPPALRAELRSALDDYAPWNRGRYLDVLVPFEQTLVHRSGRGLLVDLTLSVLRPEERGASGGGGLILVVARERKEPGGDEDVCQDGGVRVLSA